MGTGRQWEAQIVGRPLDHWTWSTVYTWSTLGLHLVYTWSTCGLHAAAMSSA